ncbi:hypothetical protein G7Z17_g3099 [Cylindrodendrum hubeiense]|uniref:Serine protease n=1 Tax=Cylindrodendrum hubeiense TaxID=595255 RepID=A0A9P5HBH5_9HYPO|nr:hypothetical protein G7Z17_g3099 [Cylindrodendrum hubeiense]
MATPISTEAAVWRLELPTSPDPAPDTIPPTSSGRENDSRSVVHPDMRNLVDENDIRDGGKYRSIVKIQALVPTKLPGESAWLMGTGWLIRPNLLVTAAHVVYHLGDEGGFGPIKQIKCYIGYNGRASVASNQVQVRYGQFVVLPAEWLKAPDNRTRNVAFVRLENPFHGDLRLFSFSSTPEVGESVLGLVGYPRDHFIFDDEIVGEFGAQIYEQFYSVSYDLLRNNHHMIEYKISTYLGLCGAPILDKHRNTVIGTHCYNSGGFGPNAGSPINGRFGNDYHIFVNLLNDERSIFGTSHNVRFIDIYATDSQSITAEPPSKYSTLSFLSRRDRARTADMFAKNNVFNPHNRDIATLPGIPEASPENSSSNSHDGGIPARKRTLELAGDASFFDILKKVAQVGSTAGPPASSLLGPLGGLASIAAGAFLTSICRVGMSSGGFTSMDGIAERALLAEATLQAVLRMEQSPERRDITDKMQRNWSDNAPNIDAIASWLALALTQCALDLAVHRLSKTTDPRRRREEDVSFLPQRRHLNVNGAPASPLGGRDFFEGLFQPTLVLAGEEELLEWLASAMEGAALVKEPLVSEAAKSAITSLVPKLVGESECIANQPKLDRDAMPVLFNRAMVADIALQALMDLPREKLERIRLNVRDGQGLFDFIKTALQKMGPSTSASLKKSFQELVPSLTDAAHNHTPRQLGAGPLDSGRGGVNARSHLSIMDMLSD